MSLKLFGFASIVALASTGILFVPACAGSSPSEDLAHVSQFAGEDAGIKRGDLVISQVYGAGGQANAPFVRDYIELFNRSQATITLTGLSVQSTAHDQSVFGNIIELTGTIEAGKYYLIAGASQGAVGAELPTPVSQTTDVDLPPDKGKVALVAGTTALNCEPGPRCPNAKTIDLVGYGSASDFEGASQVQTLSATKAALRKENGCQDKDNNGDDFTTPAPNPRTSATAANKCPAPDAGAPRPDASPPGPPPVVKDPELGEESDFDAGVRRDAGTGSTASGAEASDCAVANVGGSLSHDASIMGIVMALGIALAAVLRRRDS